MNKKDYAKIKYPIHLLKKDESVFELGDLRPLKDIFTLQDELENAMGLDKEFVMKYIILMNAPGSPAIDKYPHLGKRRTWVMSELGVEPDDRNRYEDKYDYMILNKIPSVVRKISVFRTLQKPTDFTIMRHAEEELENLLKPADDSVAPELSVPDTLKKRQLIDLTRKQYESARDRMIDFSKDRTEQQDIEEFVAQTYLGIRHEETLMILPPPVEPSKVKANTIFPEVRN